MAPAARALARLLLVAVLFLPSVRGWFGAAGLDWAYLAALAWALAFFGVPVARRVAFAAGILDEPAARKVHHAPTPLLGGAAVYAAFAVTVVFNFNFSRGLKGILVGATVVVVLGVLDDVWNLPAPVKLAGQVAAVGAAVAYGVVLSVAPHWLAGAAVLNLGLTLLWFLAVTNAVQFLDGMDGLAAGLGVIAGLFFSISALQTGQSYLFILAAPLVGACLGFLPYNFRRAGARIFLGDAGASFIGFTLAGLAVVGEWADDDPIVALLTPILILAVPLFDIAFIGVIRVVTGKVHSLREWLAYTGKDHIHHRFEALGLSKAQSVLLILFIAGTLGLSAIQLRQATAREAALILLQAGCVLAIIAILENLGRGRSGRP
jgi:UDP-GlcNAc:undecaprenyl-phosphate/decaprenyl-phosphate GlcNAc-1-phosphate transferase